MSVTALSSSNTTSNGPPGSRIAVVNASMDVGLNTNVLFYFLAQRPCAFHAVLLRRPFPPEDAAALRASLTAPSTSAVVLWDGFGAGLGRTPLDLELQHS